MTHAIDPVEFAKTLIAAPSVTPATGAVFDAIEAALMPLGFTVERFIDVIEPDRSEEHTSELQSLMRISYAVFCLKKKNTHPSTQTNDPAIHLSKLSTM